MKIKAIISNKDLMVSMTVQELLELTGKSEVLNHLFSYGREISSSAKVVGVEVAVSSIFRDARETLEAYEGINTNMKAVNMLMANLLGKMDPNSRVGVVKKE
jgi:hypothetical protein